MKLWKKKKMKKKSIKLIVEGAAAIRERRKRPMLDLLKLSNHANYLSESRRLAVIESSNNLQDEEAASKRGKSLVPRRRKSHHVKLEGKESELRKISKTKESNRQMHPESRTLFSMNELMNR